MPLYTGVNGVNRRVSTLFQGDNGVNRIVSRLYEGVNGVNRQVFSGNLLITNGTRAVVPLNNLSDSSSDRYINQVQSNGYRINSFEDQGIVYHYSISTNDKYNISRYTNLKIRLRAVDNITSPRTTTLFFNVSDQFNVVSAITSPAYSRSIDIIFNNNTDIVEVNVDITNVSLTGYLHLYPPYFQGLTSLNTTLVEYILT